MWVSDLHARKELVHVMGDAHCRVHKHVGQRCNAGRCREHSNSLHRDGHWHGTTVAADSGRWRQGCHTCNQ